MKEDEDDAAPRSSGAAKGKKKKKTKRHLHIGPFAKAYRSGWPGVSCPVCDAEQILRLTYAEQDSERAAKIAADMALRSARLARR